MATSTTTKEESDGDPGGGRDTLQELLFALKSTVEGLLASHSTYVWSTYGGLTRLCNAVNKILRHQLRQNQTLFTNLDDHWVFIKRLRTLNPVLAPSIDQISRQAVEQGCVKGELWVRISLENLSLSSQLKLLVENEEHAQLCYHSGAFIRSPSHFLALYLCLQAVERNDISVLADIDPSLLRKRKVSHNRSSSLPGGLPFNKTMPIMQRKPSYDDTTPPLFASPKSESVLTTSDEHALPSPPSADSLGEKRTSAKDALTFVLHGSSAQDINRNAQIKNIANDPLLNQSFLPEHGSDGRTERSTLTNENNDRKRDRFRKRKGICECKAKSAIDSEWKSEMEAALVHGGGNAYCCLCGKKLKLPRSDTNSVRRNSSQSNLRRSSATLPTQNNQLFGDDDDKVTMVAHKKKRRSLQKINSLSDANLNALGEDEFDGSVFSLPNSLERVCGSLLEEGSFSVSPVTDCYFPRPVEGQSLLSFLSSKDFKKCPELDRENAHFCISEAIIAAVEQIKCRPLTGHNSDRESDGSDEEIQELKQRIRIRRNERHSQKVRVKSLLSDGESKTETTTTSSSGESSPRESSDDLEHFESSSDSSEDELTDKSSNLVSMETTGLSGSMASLYSDADVRRGIVAATRIIPAVPSVTAEAVALSLLKKFSEKHLPAASDLEWMVTEHDAPQALLPLPKSVPISPDQADNINSLTGKTTRIRGNLDWAPPRAQIVFNVHQTLKRKVVMTKQNQRCAGCGMRVEVGYQKRLRYCHYLGKYFCHCCHNNSTAVIPGHILEKWDFRKYSVSNFSLELLRKMHNDALFNVLDRNAQLYRRINALEQCRDLRLQLYHLKDFLKTCRIGQSLLPNLEQYPQHLYTDIHIYSIHDLLRVKSGELLEELKVLVEDIKNHVKQCQLCQARGFICELCNKDSDIIFPFELNKTHQCQDCWTCYHIACFQTTKVCKKCERIKARRSIASNSRQQPEPTKGR